MVFFEPQSRDKSLFPHDPFKALVTPRPIGWISTVSAKGELNLAPYSYFNAFSSSPPIVGFSSEGDKDSSSFAMESGEFVWSMATWDLRDQMNASAASDVPAAGTISVPVVDRGSNAVSPSHRRYRPPRRRRAVRTPSRVPVPEPWYRRG